MNSTKPASAFDKIKNLVAKPGKDKKIDEGAIEDLNELGNNIASASEGNPRWMAFISPYKAMFNDDILSTDIEKISEMIGFSKKAEEFLKGSADTPVVNIGEITLKGKIVKLKEIGDSIARRVAKMTAYWSKGNKKNSLFVACMVASYMSVCLKFKSYSYMYTQVLVVLEAFAKLVKSRFKRLIIENSENPSRKVKEGDFLGAKVSESVLEIAENWNTFVD